MKNNNYFENLNYNFYGNFFFKFNINNINFSNFIY